MNSWGVHQEEPRWTRPGWGDGRNETGPFIQVGRGDQSEGSLELDTVHPLCLCSSNSSILQPHYLPSRQESRYRCRQEAQLWFAGHNDGCQKQRGRERALQGPQKSLYHYAAAPPGSRPSLLRRCPRWLQGCCLPRMRAAAA